MAVARGAGPLCLEGQSGRPRDRPPRRSPCPPKPGASHHSPSSGALRRRGRCRPCRPRAGTLECNPGRASRGGCAQGSARRRPRAALEGLRHERRRCVSDGLEGDVRAGVAFLYQAKPSGDAEFNSAGVTRRHRPKPRSVAKTSRSATTRARRRALDANRRREASLATIARRRTASPRGSEVRTSRRGHRSATGRLGVAFRARIASVGQRQAAASTHAAGCFGHCRTAAEHSRELGYSAIAYLRHCPGLIPTPSTRCHHPTRSRSCPRRSGRVRPAQLAFDFAFERDSNAAANPR